MAAYGAAKFATGGRRQMAMPTPQALKECVQRFKTVRVDEFRTTMMYLGDGSTMKQVWSKHKEAVFRGLMGCGSTNGKFIKCNPNTALNLRRCLDLPVRLAELCRVAVQGRVQRAVGKVIQCVIENKIGMNSSVLLWTSLGDLRILWQSKGTMGNLVQRPMA